MTGIGGVEQTGAEEETVNMELACEVPGLVPNSVDNDGFGKDELLKDTLSSPGARPVTSGVCLVCGMDLITGLPGFRTCAVTMDASKLTLEERLSKIFGLPSATFEGLRSQETVTCARCLALIFRVDFLEVELPKTKAHLRYLFSKNKTKVFELPSQSSGHSGGMNPHQQNHLGSSSSSSSQQPFSRPGASSTQQKSHQSMPPLYPSGLMNALSQPLASTSTGSSTSSMFAGLSNSALAAASSAALLFNSTANVNKRPPSASILNNAASSSGESSPPPGSPSRKSNEVRAKMEAMEEGEDEEDVMALDDEDGEGRRRKRPVPPMRPLLDKKPNENGLERTVKQEEASMNDDDEADETPRKLSRQELEQRLRGNGTTSPAPSNLSSVAEGEMDLNTSDDGERQAAAFAAAARRYQAGDFSALMGAHPDFSSFEGAIAERLKATSSAGGLTAEEVLANAGALGVAAGGKLGNPLDSSSANILNSLSSLSSLVGADPARMGLGTLGMPGYSPRNPLLSSRSMRMNKTGDDYPASLSGFSSDSHAKCWLCHLDCRTYKKVEEHFKKEHPGETPFVCEKCGGEFRDLSSYRNHVYYENRKEKLAKGQIKPKNSSGSSGSMMNSSSGSSSGRRSGRMPDFPASLLTGGVDPTASSSSSSSSMRCELCKLPFGTESALKEHYLKEHGGMGASPEDFNVSLEQYALYSQALLNAHKEYVLTQQKEAVQLQRQLQQHMSGASTSGTNAGSSSSLAGGSKSGSSSSGGGGGGSYVCEECNASFKSREGLSVHKFQDHGAKDSLMKLFSGA